MACTADNIFNPVSTFQCFQLLTDFLIQCHAFYALRPSWGILMRLRAILVKSGSQ
jgi:hypothetical protein